VRSKIGELFRLGVRQIPVEPEIQEIQRARQARIDAFVEQGWRNFDTELEGRNFHIHRELYIGNPEGLRPSERYCWAARVLYVSPEGNMAWIERRLKTGEVYDQEKLIKATMEDAANALYPHEVKSSEFLRSLVVQVIPYQELWTGHPLAR